MEELYLNVFKNIQGYEDDYESSNLLEGPIYVDWNSFTAEGIHELKDIILKGEELDNNPYVKQMKYVVPLVKNFYARDVMDLKITLGSDEYLIYAVDYSLSDMGLYGATTIRELKKLLPADKELELSRKAYDIIHKGFMGVLDLESELVNLFSDYKKNQGLTSTFGRMRGGVEGDIFSLEKIVKSNVMPKWDFYIMQNGVPVTSSIFTYHPKKDFMNPTPDFRKRDMKKVYDFKGFGEVPLDSYHTINCANINASYILCNNLGNLFNKETNLQQITTNLHNNLGVGFTFLQPFVLNDFEALICLDVKNEDVSKRPASIKGYYPGMYKRFLSGKELIALQEARKCFESKTYTFDNCSYEQDEFLQDWIRIVKELHA